MREIIKGDPEKLITDIKEAHAFRKMKNASPVADTIVLNANKAYELFTQLAAPECVLTEVGYPEFLDIYSGEGLNEPRSPLGEIMSEDFVYMLFAMTLGENASSQISDLFQNGNHLVCSGNFNSRTCEGAIPTVHELHWSNFNSRTCKGATNPTITC